MTDDSEFQINKIKDELHALHERVETLEQEVVSLKEQSQSPIKPVIATNNQIPTTLYKTPVIETSSQKPIAQEESISSQDAKAPLPIAAVPTADITNTLKTNEGLEIFIGKNLQKFGIAFVVLGCALGLVYELQYFTPLMKILCGVLLGVGLIVAGHLFGKKSTEKWYWYGLSGGGWALTYFTLYAAYHFESVKIIDSSVVDLALLLLTAAGAIKHSLMFKSETITGLSFSLAFLTTSISDVSLFTLISAVLLVGSLSYLVVRMRWHGMLVYSMAIFYGIYFFRIVPLFQSPQFMGFNAGESAFWLTFLCSFLCWGIFNLVMFLLQETNDYQKTMLAIGTWINASIFTLGVLTQLPSVYADWRALFLFLLGILYGILVPIANARNISSLANINTYLALLLCTCALPFKFSGENLTILLRAEVPLLVGIGLQYSLPALRIFAVALAMIDVLNVYYDSIYFLGPNTFPVVLKIMSIMSMAISGGLYKHPGLAKTSNITGNSPFWFYIITVALMCALVTPLGLDQKYLPFIYTIEYAAFIYLGFKLKDKCMRATGGVGLCSCVFGSLLFTINSWETLPTLAIVIVLYSLGRLYKMFLDDPEIKLVAWVNIIYSAGATITLTILLSKIFISGWLSASWAVEGMILLLYGFQFTDKTMRVSGLSVLGLVIIKLLCVDLASAEMIYRILSFIIAGVALLVSSYAYARFASSKTEIKQDK